MNTSPQQMRNDVILLRRWVLTEPTGEPDSPRLHQEHKAAGLIRKDKACSRLCTLLTQNIVLTGNYPSVFLAAFRAL